MIDEINPIHYNFGKIECIEALEGALNENEYIGFLKGNIVKYIWRLNLKGEPLTNLKKAAWYLNKLIEVYEGKEYGNE